MSTDDPTGAEQEITPEQLAMAFAERIGKTPVRDILLQTLASFVDVAGIRLGFGPEGEGPRDLPQARQAIEALRALVEVAERELGAAQVRPFREPLAALQMAYAEVAEGGAGEGDEPPPGAPERTPAGPPPRAADDPGSRLWTPPGSRK